MFRAGLIAALAVLLIAAGPIPLPKPANQGHPQAATDNSNNDQPRAENQPQASKSNSPPIAGANEKTPLYVKASCEHGCGHSEDDKGLWEKVVTDPNALFALAVAAFTGGLLGMGAWTNCLIVRQINLGRDEFNATHRPEIIVHTAMNATAVKIGGGEVVGITIVYFNKGTSPAKNTKLFASVIGIKYGGSLEDARFMDRVGEPPGPVVSGKPYSFTTWSNVDIKDTEFGDSAPDGIQPPPKFTVYCIGTINYEDASGVQRQTGFCWKWERKKWVRVTGNSYDYEY